MAEKNSWVKWVAVIALIFAVLALGLVLNNAMTGGVVYTNEAGILRISSYPSNTSVFVDNTYQGMTPITVSGLVEGSHTVKFSKPGYEDYVTTPYVYLGKINIVRINMVEEES